MKLFSEKKWSVYVICIILAVSAGASFFAKKVEIDHDYERFFSKNDPDLQKYREYTAKFNEEDGDIILVGVQDSSGIFNSTFMGAIKNSGNEIKALPNVKNVISPCHNCFYGKISGLVGFEKKDCIGFNNFEADSIRIYKDKKLKGSLFSADGDAVLLYIIVEQNINKTQGEKLMQDLQIILDKNKLNKPAIAGKIRTISHYSEKMMEELSLFFITSVILVCIFLLVSYRMWWAVVIPLIIIVCCIIWTVATMVLTGKSFDVLMVMLPTIIFVVGMSDIVHFLNKYLDELRKGQEKTKAITSSYKEVGLATLLTSCTTAIGFFSLLAVDVVPVQEFGVYAGIGVIIAYVLTFCFLPFCLILIPVPTQFVSAKKSIWSAFLDRSFLKIARNQKRVITISCLLLVGGILGTSFLPVNTYLLEDLSATDPVKMDYVFFEEKFSGARPMEIELKVGSDKNNIFDFQVAREIEKIEKYIENSYTESGAGFLLSPIDPIKYLYKIKHANNEKYFKLPKKEKTYLNLLKEVKKHYPIENASVLISSDSLYARISGKIKDLGSHVIDLENNKFNRFVSDSINPNYLVVSLTGTPLLLDKNNRKLSSNIMLGLGAAFVIIGLIIGLIYKNWAITIISLAVNTLPLFIISGLMLLMGFDIKTSTALIFTLAFGIAVDDTIHMLSKLKIELRKGSSVIVALRRSYLSTGKAIIVTSLILCGGFLTLICSDFTSVYTMGLLISITLFIAVILDLTLLPVLILMARNTIKPNR